MLKWLASMHKEWRLLARDRTGLLLLFVMPAALVVVITLVQGNIMRQTGGLRIAGALVNHDGGQAAQILIRELLAAEAVTFRAALDGRVTDEGQAVRMNAQGQNQFYATIPRGLTEAVTESVRRRIDRLVAGEPSDAVPAPQLPHIVVLFDPAVQGIYRTAVSGAVRQAVAVMQAEYSMKYLSDALEQQLRRRLNDAAGAFAPQIPGRLVPSLQGEILKDPLVGIAVRSSGPDKYNHLPTAVQQNVPAWALFGMFFIVVPLSGSLVRERREGILARLMIMPVSKTALIMGKLSAYVGVCLIQFLFIVAVGKWVLPLLGTDPLVLTQRGAMLIVALCSALAATGYGIMLGVVAHTNEQAAILGPVSIVMAAALGGIMVPVFAMPQAMQVISRGSPLAWAHEAFMTLLVRGGSLSAVWGQLALLVLFFAATLLVALIGLQRRRHW
ncbi:MAG: ABC transporter permease [Desulfobacteraceae bacterium]|nr:MAG: ABC transporter permease [Desulfobacteraceae bacterium]